MLFVPKILSTLNEKVLIKESSSLNHGKLRSNARASLRLCEIDNLSNWRHTCALWFAWSQVCDSLSQARDSLISLTNRLESATGRAGGTIRWSALPDSTIPHWSRSLKHNVIVNLTGRPPTRKTIRGDYIDRTYFSCRRTMQNARWNSTDWIYDIYLPISTQMREKERALHIKYNLFIFLKS